VWEFLTLFDFVQYGASQIETFLLVIMRASGVLLIAPIFSHRAIPSLAKIGLLLVLGLTMTPTLSIDSAAVDDSLWYLAGLCAKEVLVGVIIGLVFQLLFIAAKTAGSLIGYQIGFALVSTPDVEDGGQITILGTFWTMVALLIFVTIDGHHLIISAFADSYAAIPPGLVTLDSGVGEMIIKYTAYVFIIALKMSAPVMIALFLTDVALGIIAKTIPTMNVFFVGFPIKVAVGLLVIAMSLPVFSYLLRQATGYLNGELHYALAAMGKA
jgi:flagellar biosynthetic protein FliR